MSVTARPLPPIVTAPAEATDPARLDALCALDVLDTPPEAGFDDAVRLASEICGTPTALVSLVAADRQWFKARVGFTPVETPIEQSVCAHALADDDLLVIPDLRADARTRDNSLVTKAPFLRFYAGAPLRTPDGVALGTLCVIDTKPRPEGLAPNQASALRALARQVMNLLELRRAVQASEASLRARDLAQKQLQASESRYRAMFESAIDYAIVVTDLQGRVTNWNEGAIRTLGWTRQEMIGQPIDTFFSSEDRADGTATKEMRSALALGRGIDERWHVRRDGSRFWANGEMMALRDESGAAIGFIKILRDRTEQKRSALALQTSEANLRTILDTVPLGILFAEAPSGRIVGGNARAASILGRSLVGAEGGRKRYAFHADGRPIAASEYPLAKVLAGAPDATLEARYQRPDGSMVWVDMVGAPVRAADGSVKGVVVAISDIDARKRAEAMQDLLNGELSHRMKNLLAMVQAIARQTMRGTADLATMREILSNRLVALGKAHDILIEGTADPTGLGAVLRSGIGIHDEAPGRFTYNGPDVEVSGKAVMPLSLMLHELSTNAAKYGALSTPEGRVALDWSILRAPDRPDGLRLVWRESGGPAVEPPRRKGFGSWVIERGLIDQVGGTISLDYTPSGLVCTLEAPLLGFQQAA